MKALSPKNAILLTALLFVLPLDGAGRLQAASETADLLPPTAFDLLVQALPEPRHHFEGGSEADWADWLDLNSHFQRLQQERREGRWFAALVSDEPGERNAVRQRFAGPEAFYEFLEHSRPLVEVFATTVEGSGSQRRRGERRLTALEVAALREADGDLPTWIKLTFLNPEGRPATFRVEFSLQAASIALDTLLAYERQRAAVETMGDVLATRGGDGRISALAQWEALHRAVLDGALSLAHLPVPPTGDADPFVAFEFAVDDQGRFRRFERVYRESEITKDLRGGTQQLWLRPSWSREEKVAQAFQRRPGSNRLELLLNPLLGQDPVELRIVNLLERDPGKWSVLEFGEPEILRQTALAQFSLVNASLERQRKRIALKKNTIDLYVEPAIAGANLGGALAGAGFPIGEALRLAYNLTVSPRFLADVPTVNELRQLFLLLAARKQDPELAGKAADWLTSEDLRKLEAQVRRLPPETLRAAFETVSDDDLHAMLVLARLQGKDARYRLFVDILSSAAQVAQVDPKTFLGRVLNNPYFALNGDISLKNILAALIGEKSIIYPNGGSMEDLLNRGGMPKEWLQYFNVTVDLRAIANTLHRLTHEDLADRELRQPFPYAPRVDDLAAYEIRVFGFPLLIYYKRGLLKDDIHAFETDYAYTVLGSRIVEHFATREDLEHEIRARRVVPLGYVQVRDAGGRLRESNLAVFARVFPERRHRGRTGIVLYGLRAFHEYSALIDRERQRFADYERLLQEGGVIERVVQAEDRHRLPSLLFEPVFHHGAAARGERFSRPLAALRELQRSALRRQWGLPVSDQDRALTTQLRDELRRLGLDAGDDNTPPWLEADSTGATYRFRQQVNGGWRIVERTAVTAPPDLQRDLARAREAREVEDARRQNLAASDGNLILLNEIVPLDGQNLLGPLRRNPRDGSVRGFGVLSTSHGAADFWTHLNQLPVTTRAALAAAQFAAQPLDLDLDGDGTAQTVFVTVEFPAAAEIRMPHVRPGAEPEVRVIREGLERERVTAGRVVEIDHDRYRQENATRTYLNQGTLDAPIRGPLLEQTRSLDHWLRAPGAAALDPDQPRIARLLVQHVTGDVRLETYGSYERPIRVVDARWITEHAYDPFGQLSLSRTRHNGLDAADFERSPIARLLEPSPGLERYELRPAPSAPGTSSARFEQVDLLSGLTNMLFFDQAHSGRKSGDLALDPFDGSQSFLTRTTNHYREDFHFGLIPYRSERRDAATDSLLAAIDVESFNASTRELVGRETDYTGKSLTTLWRAPSEKPVSVESGLRRTEYQYDPWELRFTARTLARDTGEELSRDDGEYDGAVRAWRVRRVLWHRPGSTNRTEEILLSAGGRPILTLGSGVWETRSFYDQRGFLATNRVAFRTNATQPFAQLARLESDFRWREGTSESLVQTFVDGAPHDAYRVERDAEGRVVRGGIRAYPGLELTTETIYDGATDRVLESRDFQNRRLRLTRTNLPEVTDPQGRVLLPIVLRPEWGITITQVSVLGDPWGRPLTSTLPNGDQTVVRDWFPGTGIARVTEIVSPSGLARERLITRLNAGEEAGVPIDLTTRHRLGPGGTFGLAATEARARGTGIPIRRDAAGRRARLQLDLPYEAPLLAVDPAGRGGVSLRAGGRLVEHVVAVFSTQTNTVTLPGTTEPQPGFEQLEIDLQSLFFHRVIRRTFDAQGSLLEESTARMPGLDRPATREDLIAAAATAQPLRRFRYFYDPGWLVERRGAAPAQYQWTYTRTDRPEGAVAWPVNAGGNRDFVSSVEGTRDLPGATNPATAPELDAWLVRHLERPRLVAVNPFLPGITNCWTVWTARELDRNGQLLFEAEMYYDAQGRLRSSGTVKQTPAGAPATRTTYQLADHELPLLELALPPSGQIVDLPLAGSSDWSESDFVCWQVDSTAPADWTLQLTDDAGQKLRLGSHRADPSAGRLSFWTPDTSQQLWLPNSALPRRVCSVTAPPAMIARGQWLVVAVPELTAAGLDAGRIRSVQIEGSTNAPATARFSLPLRLNRQGPAVALDSIDRVRHRWISDPTGYDRVETSSLTGVDDVDLTGSRTASSILFNDLPVAITRPPSRPSPHPTLVFIDHSDGESPRPLFAVSSQDGHLIEHYRKLEVEDAIQLYTVVHGFATPQFEVFRRSLLGDDFSPGFMAYGYQYHASVQYQRGSGWLGGSVARWRNRIAANSFNYFGGRLAAAWWRDLWPLAFSPKYDYHTLHRADAQARAIEEIPSLAQALLPYREPALIPSTASQLDPIDVDTRALRLRLLELHVTSFPSNATRFLEPTYLIPTAPDSEARRHVDTEAEADLILLAIHLGEYNLAGELLEFYRRKSREGRDPLHASYDAFTGTAMVREFGPARPMQSQQTAEAQISIAEAALELGLRTSNHVWVSFGRALLDLALHEFRNADHPTGPGGLTRYRALSRFPVLGLELWPAGARYPVGVNARSYLLLRRLVELEATAGSVAPLIAGLRPALTEQELWLREQVLPRVQSTGVVPAALFEIQDINGRTTALAAERWTSAGDWLTFLEAAHTLGVDNDTTRAWLDHLLRIHGVRVGESFGLDPALPLLRPAALSVDLTARLYRLARLLDHPDVAQAAATTLSRLQSGLAFPTLITAAIPTHPLPSGMSSPLFPATNRAGWPDDLRPFRHLISQSPPGLASAEELAPADRWQLNDLLVFSLITAGFYALILLATLLWWRFRKFRPANPTPLIDERLLSEATLQLAEERWARRILGVQTPAGAEHTRLSNATLEQNFLLQLRTLYKMVLEWRRQENGWTEDDPRLVEDESDDWINGIDEYASCLGIYLRYVIKAGAKDGLSRKDFIEECEDGNHIWSRMVMFLSEYYWGMLTLLRSYNNAVTYLDKSGLYGEITRLLHSLGVRQRPAGFDARTLFNYPDNPAAFDLLKAQNPATPLAKVLLEASLKLRVPYAQLLGMIEKYKTFKRREALDPLHPYLIEFAKTLPHFFLMGLGALVWFNQRTLGDSPIVPYLWSQIADQFQTPWTLAWALPLLAGGIFTFLAHFVRIYRFEGSMLPRDLPRFIFDSTLTSLFGKKHTVMPEAKPGRLWNPRPYEWSGWGLRALGWLILAWTLLYHPGWEPPSFATFLVVKGLFATLALMEVLGIVIPLAASYFARWLQDAVARHPRLPGILRFIHRLNFSPTRPASPIWLALKYVTQPSVPSGDARSLAQSICAYFILAALFFFVGAFLCQGILSLWFTENYLTASNTKLFLGALVFWNTMYLLRYGMFLLATAVASIAITYPFRTLAGFAGLAWLVLGAVQSVVTTLVIEELPEPLAWLVLGAVQSVNPASAQGGDWSTWTLVSALALLAVFETPLLRRFRPALRRGRADAELRSRVRERLDQIRSNDQVKAGIVYMSGDDLGYLKLTPDLMMTRWSLLRDKFGSRTVHLAHRLVEFPDDDALRAGFTCLYELERHHQVTLWHPRQLLVEGEPATLPGSGGLHLFAASPADRRRILAAWQVRRWVVTMMSTAGHSQDTAINLVDIALRLQDERLARNTVFYLIQNKYDDRDNNRPIQLRYHEGELGQREKLCRLLEALAPGVHAYSVQNWTPFGFKAGGMTGMDLVHEENLRVSTMVVLDRNATINDLDAFIEDLTEALTDPNLVIIIPGRGTTNTLTTLGQASQMIEEGHRSFLKGLMGWLGGEASECLGTGWGNIVVYSYGRVQRAMLDPHTPKMPLTSRMQRGSSFHVRTEGLIGFTPHAVGISEDTWAVSQATHNLIALGGRVRYRLSRAFWHKIRETWSHAEWLASFPRWSGGYLQMMQDAVMQRINDFGPLSIFAKEMRAFSGRAYLTAPFALVNVLCLPLAILFDVTPFVQILIVLWNFGFVMNQVLTLHGLNAYLEATGFSRLGAVAGTALALLASLSQPALLPYAPGLTLLGTCLGGFWMGLARWSYTRLRDILLFGPQLILHTLGQVMRQTIEFVASGAAANDAQRVNMAYRAWAGPREDQPLASYPHFINLRTVVWWIGLPSVILNLLALSNLDMFNVILLLPSLLFSVSVFAGPYLMTPRAGHEAMLPVRLTKWLAWPAAFLFFTAVSMLVARGGTGQLAAAAFALAVCAAVLAGPCRHFGHRFGLNRARRRLLRQLALAGVKPDARARLADQLIGQANDTAKLDSLLEQTSVLTETRGAILRTIHRRILPRIQGPTSPPPPRQPKWERVIEEFRRSFIVALLTLLWFFVVPVPGLFVFIAGDYRTTMTLGDIMTLVLAGVSLTIVGHWTAELLQYARRPNPLEARAHRAFVRLLDGLTAPVPWPDSQVSRLCALFTDLKTYLDQKASAYASHCLQRIEDALAAPGDPPDRS